MRAIGCLLGYSRRLCGNAETLAERVPIRNGRTTGRAVRGPSGSSQLATLPIRSFPKTQRRHRGRGEQSDSGSYPLFSETSVHSPCLCVKRNSSNDLSRTSRASVWLTEIE